MAKHETTSLMVQGGTMGSYFGPVGAFLGAAAGAFIGGKQKKAATRAQFELRKKNTQLAYEVGESTISSIKKTRENAAKTYETNISMERAKFAASGAELSGRAWEAIIGREAKKRNEALAEADLGREKFEASDTYKILQEDRETAFDTGKKGKAGTTNVSALEKFGLSVTGKDVYSKETRQVFNDTGLSKVDDFYDKYRDSLTPTKDEFEMLNFGTDAEQQQVQSDLQSRIGQAGAEYNAYWDSRIENTRGKGQAKDPRTPFGAQKNAGRN